MYKFVILNKSLSEVDLSAFETLFMSCRTTEPTHES